MYIRNATLAMTLLSILACNTSHTNANLNTLTDQEKKDGWILLFDGKTTNGWRTYKKESPSELWKVIDGSLVLTQKGGGDLIYNKKFKDFELTLEWQITENGNSGIFWRASEDDKRIYMTSAEYQVVDNYGDKYGKTGPDKKAGAEFDLYETDPKLANPPGQWNKTRIIVKGNNVQYFLNDKKTVEYTLQSEDWKSKVKETKFAKWPKYANNKEGFIGLQDHGDKVLFRDIKLRPL